MRQDQFERLQALSEKLTDVLVDELEVEHWPGNGIALQAMDKNTRGDRYWSKKNAGMTLTVLTKLHTIVEMTRRGSIDLPGTESADDDGDLATEIMSAEREAQRIINKALSHAKSGRGRKRAGK